MYKLKKIVGSNIFSEQFIKIISHYKIPIRLATLLSSLIARQRVGLETV